MVLGLPRWSVSVALAIALAGASAAAAAERTFTFAPAGLVGVVDDFNATLLAHSDSLGRALSVRSGVVKLAGRGCPSLAVDPLRRLTRVRVLDSAARAALLAGRRTPNTPLATALTTMGAAAWRPPASGRVGRPSWIVEPALLAGVLGFSTIGYPNGEGAGAVNLAARTDTKASLRVDVDLAPGTPDPADLVLAITTELPPRRLDGRWKRTECYVLAACEAADVQALVDLVAAAPLADVTRNRLNNILADAVYWTAQQDSARAARNVKIFATEVASRSASEIPPDAAEAMTTRALSVIDALGL